MHFQHISQVHIFQGAYAGRQSLSLLHPLTRPTTQPRTPLKMMSLKGAVYVAPAQYSSLALLHPIRRPTTQPRTAFKLMSSKGAMQKFPRLPRFREARLLACIERRPMAFLPWIPIQSHVQSPERRTALKLMLLKGAV